MKKIIILFTIFLFLGGSSSCSKEKAAKENLAVEKGHDDHGKKDDHDKDDKHDDDNHGKKDDHDKVDKHDDDDHDDEGGSEFGPKKGVRKYEESKGIVLGKEAYRRFKVGLTSLRKLKRRGSTYTIPLAALILEENDKGVYVKNGEFMKFIHVNVVGKNARSATVRFSYCSRKQVEKANCLTSQLNRSNSIVSTSAALVRIAELNAAGASGEGHGH